MFTYAVKTDKSHDYFTVICAGTKKYCMTVAKTFDNLAETIESKITRKDGKVVHHYVR